MADSGLLRFLGNGVRFALNAAASTYVGLRVNGSVSSSFYLNLPTSLPGSTQALTVDASGNVGYQALGGGGSVTSVALSLPAIFSVSGSPVTADGTLTATLANQSGNVVFASPSNGSSGAPTFRSLVAADIPTLTAAKVSDFDTQVRTNRLDQLTAPTASVSFNSQKITSLADGTSTQDAATWGQVQALFNGTDNKASVRVATTANITLSGTQTIDGVALSAGDRVLVKNQSTASQNGIYVVAAGSWSRATDADISAEFTSGLNTFVSAGSTLAATLWFLNTADPITLGTTAITFTQIGAANSYTAGNGLQLSGNTFSVLGTTNRITVSGSGVDISASYVGQNTITTLGTITTGTWTGTAIAVANGGTGASSAASARTNLAAAGIYKTSFTNASLTAGVLTINPGLGQQYGQLTIIDNNNKMIIPDDVTFTSSTSWAIDLTSYGTISSTWQAIAVA